MSIAVVFVAVGMFAIFSPQGEVGAVGGNGGVGEACQNNADCADTCINGVCTSVCTNSPGTCPCDDNEDCPADGEDCVAGLCGGACSPGACDECSANEICNPQTCACEKQQCDENNPCDPGEICQNGECEIVGECEDDNDCGRCEVCLTPAGAPSFCSENVCNIQDPGPSCEDLGNICEDALCCRPENGDDGGGDDGGGDDGGGDDGGGDDGGACVPTEEICDGVDNDCDEAIDEDGVCPACDADNPCAAEGAECGEDGVCVVPATVPNPVAFFVRGGACTLIR
jgi:hypothetical protein